MGKYLVVFVAGFFLAFAIFHRSSGISDAPEVARRGLATVSTSKIGGASPSLAVSQSEAGQTYRVARVIDGDTIELANGEKVRYVGMDTPETVDPRKSVQCFGVEASKRNKELVEGKTVRLERDVSDRDHYGRLLRFVYVDDVFINLELVREGYAHAYDYPPDISMSKLFHDAETEARTAGRGLWGGCPSGPTASSAPAVGPLNPGAPSANCTIKGNISSSGEKIYHMLGCGSYAKTSIDTARGEKWFCTEAEATTSGWRKAGNC